MDDTGRAIGFLIAGCPGAMTLSLWTGIFPRGPETFIPVLLLALVSIAAAVTRVQDHQEKAGNLPAGCNPYPLSRPSSAFTAAACPRGFTFLQVAAMMPSGRIRNVARSTPRNVPASRDFPDQTP